MTVMAGSGAHIFYGKENPSRNIAAPARADRPLPRLERVYGKHAIGRLYREGVLIVRRRAWSRR